MGTQIYEAGISDRIAAGISWRDPEEQGEADEAVQDWSWETTPHT